ncbi:carboxymuconolactone decarboxylase family protein [Aureispira anguillae]|uniref:Carboxymuconolactone decarboxylase family protein n=1 Tax=Aureispira anguillae TaxID=2864201 RepID=A0A915YDW2_9BACT|nr:carboxymuconolactone decarboxylase family protein [Aureispira anguillae]BDS11315.1 carboxymuconolactone decarboxylase family protein [Aureispira anguillae]
MERISYQDIPKGMFENLRTIEDYITHSKIDYQLLELIKLRLSQINKCAYCVDMHYKELKHTGETELRLSSLCVWKETPFFSERERVVLQFVEELSNLSTKELSEATYESLLLYFNKAEISYLTLAIGQINTWNTLMKVFRFEPGHYQVK